MNDFEGVIRMRARRLERALIPPCGLADGVRLRLPVGVGSPSRPSDPRSPSRSGDPHASVANRGAGTQSRAEAARDAALLLEQALSGQPAAARRLVRKLTPVVQARIARVAVAWARSHGYDRVREEVSDLTQEVFASLFQDNGRIIRRWDPEKGLSLENFVGLVARRYALSALRTQKRNPFSEDAAIDDEIDGLELGTPSFESRLASRDVLRKVFERVENQLTTTGRSLFEAIVVQQMDTDAVAAQTGLSRDAVYAWRSRLNKLLRREYDRESALPPPPSSGTYAGGAA